MKNKLLNRFSILSVFLAVLVIFVPGRNIEAASINSTNVTIYVSSSTYTDNGTDDFNDGYDSVIHEYQLKVTGASSVTYSVSSGSSATVSSSGLITPKGKTWYTTGGGVWYSNSSGTVPSNATATRVSYTAGTTVIKVVADSKTYTVNVNVVDYPTYYAEQQIKNYLNAKDLSSMTDQELMNYVAAYPASFDYSASYSGYTGMICCGGGDCWASTSTIIKECEMLEDMGYDISAWSRSANKDSGAGSGHMNAMVKLNGNYYMLEAGYSGTAPRSYYAKLQTSLFSYTTTTGGVSVYQYNEEYDTYDSLTIPSTIDGKTVVGISDSFRFDRDAVKTVSLPSTLTTIGNYAFSGCTSLTSLNIPASVTSIGQGVFAQTYAMKSLTVDSSNTAYYSKDNVIYTKDGKTLVAAPISSSLSVPSGVTTIGAYAFYYNKNLTSATLPASVTTIEEGAFGNASALTSLTINGSGLTSIGDFAFANTSKLTTIRLPSSVTSLSDNSFYYAGTMDVYLMSSKAPTVSDDFAVSSSDNITFHVPSNATGYDVSPWTNFTIVYDADKTPTATPTTKASAATSTPTPTKKIVATTSTPTPTSKTSSGAEVTTNVTDAHVTYRTHVQNYGWQDRKSDGKSAGTTGESLRLEAINIKLSGTTGGIRYKTHVQTYGWQGWKYDGEASGTSGESKRLEAIQIELTGDAADKYDIYYRVHAQHFGWLSWAKNGEIAGTAGYSYRLESIQIVLVYKGDAAPGSTTTPYHVARVRYQTHVQNVGWQGLMGEGIMSGTSGKSLRLEGIKISLANKPCSGGITYRTHVQNIGWQDWVSDGAMSGTSGRSLRLEAIQIKLTGQMAEEYDVYYRVHAQNFGWLGWAKNGETSGTTGYSYRLEAIEIVLLPKGTTDSSMSTARPFVVKGQ